MKNKHQQNSETKHHELRQELNSQAYSLMKSGEFNKAKEIFKKLTIEYPDRPIGYIGLARIFQNSRNWNNAIEMWDEVLSRVDDENINPEWCAAKIKALIFSRKFTEAENFCKLIQSKKLSSPNVYEAIAQAYQQMGEIDQAINKWQEIVNMFPDDKSVDLNHARLLHLKGEFDDSENYLKSFLSNYTEALELLAKNARESRNYELAKCRWFELINLQSDRVQYKIQYIQSLLDLLEFEAAQQFFEENLEENSPCYYQALQADIYRSKYDFDTAFKILNELEIKFPNEQIISYKKVRLLITLTKSTGDLNYAKQALEIAKNIDLKDKNFNDAEIELLIILDKKEDAKLAIEALCNKQNKKSMMFQIWSSYMDGKIEYAKDLWKELKNTHKIPSLKLPESESLKQVSLNEIKIKKNSLILFTAVKNERWRLPWFLEYYRSKGVDYFFFIDNDSSDGTNEYLMQQSDVHLFWTNQVYAKAYAGMQWVNSLVDEYGKDSWCMYVDVDEALVFPGIENRSLKSITRYMEDNGHEALTGFMLDMFSPDLKSIPRNNTYKGFLKDYPLFNTDYSWVNTIGCPFKHTSGGVRKVFSLYDTQTKTPIIKGGQGINFLMSSHVISPAILSNVTCVLLHFKFAGDFENYFNEELINQTRGAECKRRHWGYLNTIEQFDDNANFISENTQAYNSSKQLIELGLISTTKEFEHKKYD